MGKATNKQRGAGGGRGGRGGAVGGRGGGRGGGDKRQGVRNGGIQKSRGLGGYGQLPPPQLGGPQGFMFDAPSPSQRFGRGMGRTGDYGMSSFGGEEFGGGVGGRRRSRGLEFVQLEEEFRSLLSFLLFGFDSLSDDR